MLSWTRFGIHRANSTFAGVSADFSPVAAEIRVGVGWILDREVYAEFLRRLLVGVKQPIALQKLPGIIKSFFEHPDTRYALGEAE
jgi:hypothetical protein